MITYSFYFFVLTTIIKYNVLFGCLCIFWNLTLLYRSFFFSMPRYTNKHVSENLVSIPYSNTIMYMHSYFHPTNILLSSSLTMCYSTCPSKMHELQCSRLGNIWHDPYAVTQLQIINVKMQRCVVFGGLSVIFQIIFC